MAQPTSKRWPLVIGLVVVAGGLLAWGLGKANQDPTVPTEQVPAGAYPTKLDESEVAVPGHGGGH